MKLIKLILLLLPVLFIYSCNTDKYPDGTYCAEINYYNPNTGTSSNYNLNIEIEERELIKILWPNGGWLDEDHFSDVIINNGGYAKFTSDKGYEYTIYITGPECSYTDADKMEYEIKNDGTSSVENSDEQTQ